MRVSCSPVLGLLCSTLLILALARCGGDDGPTEPTVGSLELSASQVTLAVAETETVTAVVRALDGQTLSDETIAWASADESVATVSATGASGTPARITAVSTGTTTVRATAAGASAQLAVAVLPRSGTLTVMTATAGPNPDDDGYTLDVSAGDSAWTEPAALSDTLTFEAVPEGDVSVSLSGAAVNCYLDGDSTRTVPVAHEQVATTAFALECKVPVASIDVSPDSIQVGLGDTVIVSAFARDSAGTVLTDRPVEWSVSDTTILQLEPLDGGDAGQGTPAADEETPDPTAQARAIGVGDGSATVGATSEGHSTEAAAESFPTGRVEVMIAVYGEAGDSPGFEVRLGARARPAEYEGGLTSAWIAAFDAVRVGSHDVLIMGLGPCRVLGSNPVVFEVQQGATTYVFVDLACPRPGTVTVQTITTGDDLPDASHSYTAWVDQESQAIGLNDDVWFSRVAEGTHMVRLTNVPTPCLGSESVPVTIDEDPGPVGQRFEADVTFEVVCNAPPEATVVTTGPGTTYVIRTGETGEGVYVAGSNEYGELGLGDNTDRNRFTQLEGINAQDLAALYPGWSAALGLNRDGTAWGTGENQGWRGDGTETDSNEPMATAVEGAESAGMGFQTVCYTKDDGTLHCAGSGSNRVNGSTERQTTFQEVEAPWDKGASVIVDLGEAVAAALVEAMGGGVSVEEPTGAGSILADGTPGTVYTWGINDFGQLGTGSQPGYSLTPVQVAGEYIAVSAGSQHVCAIGTDNAAYCWGRNNRGQLGDGSTMHRDVPTAVTGSLNFVSITSGFQHTCGRSEEGGVYCWGRNSSGQLGDGTNTDRLTPTPVDGGLTFLSISASRNHTCGVTAGDGVYCWGDNTYGQLANGTNTDRNVPTETVFEE